MSLVSTSKSITAGVVCRTLEIGDLERVEACLVRHFPERPRTFWRAGLMRLAGREPVGDFPRFGYCLAAGDEIVGVLLQSYSVRTAGSGAGALCHLSSWCVDENYRVMAPILSIAATKRKDVTYVNISPAAHTRRGIEALGFKRYTHGQMIFAPILSGRRKGARVVGWSKGSAAERSLPENERDILAHHVALGCRGFIGVLDGAAYGFVTAKTRVLRNQLPCERVIYCRDLSTLARFAGAIGIHLAARADFLCVVDADKPVDGIVGRFVNDREPKYFKGPAPPALGDLAYSELVLFKDEALSSRESGAPPAADAGGDRRDGRADGWSDRQRPRAPEARSESRRTSAQILTLAGETVSAPAILTRRHRVRSLSARDLPELAAMFRGVFRARRDAGSAALSRDLETIFLGHPHYDESTSALVYERHDGEIGGFFGSLPMRVDFMGSRRLGSIMSTWMVGDRSRDPRAGAMLLQSHLKRRHAFTLVDTANSTSLEFADSTKISILATHSLQWIKPLNYCGYAVSSLGRGRESRTLRALIGIARGSERGFRRLTGNGSSPAVEVWNSSPIDASAFAEQFLLLVQDYRVRPDWSIDFLLWLLNQSSQRLGLGHLRFREVADPTGLVVGCYAYHVTSRGRAVVLQILARRNAEAGVLRALFTDATNDDCVVVCGSTNHRLLEGLLRIPNVYYRHTCTTGVKALQPEMLNAFLAGEALVGGLVGDSWMPLTSERYD